MRSVLCRLGFHQWGSAGNYRTVSANAHGVAVEVKGIQNCQRRGCLMVRDFYKDVALRIDWAGKPRPRHG